VKICLRKSVRRARKRRARYRQVGIVLMAKRKKEPKPKKPQLYARVKSEAKKKFKSWPSAYGSAWLVREYKKRGGTYS